jgi:peroxiredoxin (alkyl hydroperoxide reductase subunit C)
VAFSDRAADFRKSEAEILGVSVDSVHTHLAWMRTPRSEAGVGDLEYPLLSDLSKKVAEAYDVLHVDRALRGVFIIDPDGTVQAGTVNNLPVGRNVDEVLRTLHAYQHVRKHGGTCPANWHEGDAGMPGTLEGVKQVIGA